MSNVITLGSSAYEAKKKEALSKELIRKEITLSEFNVVNNDSIEIGGRRIQVSPHAFNKLLGRLRIPKAFANRFKEGFGDDGLKQLVQMMKTAKAGKNDQTVTLLVDPSTRQIIDVLPAGYASISNESFFDFIEGYISGYGLEVTHVGFDPVKGIQVNASATDKLMQIPGMKKEVFNTGVAFHNTPARGFEVSPFLTRLICTNGWTSTAFTETFGLHQFNEKNVREFNEHMINMASTGFQPSGLADTIRRASMTDASLAELQSAASMIMSSEKNIPYNYVQRYAPIDRANQSYARLGHDPVEFTNVQRKNARSGMSVWDVVNGVTNFASNESRFQINDHARANLMVRAGNLLMKKNYDMEGHVNIDPFGKSSLLTENETARLAGEA